MTSPPPSDVQQDGVRSGPRPPSVSVYMAAPAAGEVFDYDTELFSLADQSYRGTSFAIYPIGGRERNSFDIQAAHALDPENEHIDVIAAAPAGERLGALHLPGHVTVHRLRPRDPRRGDRVQGLGGPRLALKRELHFAHALGVRAVLVRTPWGRRLDRCFELAKILTDFLWRRNVSYRLWVGVYTQRAATSSLDHMWTLKRAQVCPQLCPIRHIGGLPVSREGVLPLGHFDDAGNYVNHEQPPQSSPLPEGRRAKRAKPRAVQKSNSGSSTDSSSSVDDDFYADEVVNMHTLPSPSARTSPAEDTWLCWRTFRTWLRSHRSLYACLVLDKSLPEEMCSEDARTRWLAEPLAAVMLSTTTFLRRVDLPRDVTAVVSELEESLQLPRGHAAFLHMCNEFNEDVHTILVPTAEDPLNGRVRRGAKNQPTLVAALQRRVCLYQEALGRALDDKSLAHGEQMSAKYHQFAQGYDDVIQVPLQPLADHLDNFTYETFEKDVLKYEMYGKAYGLALEDMIKKRQLESAKTGSMETVTIITMLLGGGRGGIAKECLQAALALRQKLSFKLRFCIIEKNPAAVLALRHRMDKHSLWRTFKDELELWEADMRTAGPNLSADSKADIIVSELLGSFGDNELSPECLDGAMALCKRDVISIPRAYSSYVRPVASLRVMNAIFDQTPNVWALHQSGREVICPIDLHCSSTATDGAAGDAAMTDKNGIVLDSSGSRHLTECFSRLLSNRHLSHDTMFVVKMSSCYAPHPATPRRVFTFEHPDWDNLEKNAVNGDMEACEDGLQPRPSPDQPAASGRHERFAEIAFAPCSRTCEVTGLAGYFDTVLYADVKLSIVPGEHTHCPKSGESLFSWFPAFFPLRRPVLVNEGQAIVLQMARRSDTDGVWYEWRLTSPEVTQWQNSNGQSQYVRKNIASI